MNSKKGQIAIFIIVGIVLIIGAFILLNSKEEIAQKYEEEQISKIKVVDENLKPIQAFVEICMEDIATEAFRTIGENGGYLHIERKNFKHDPIDIVNNDVVIFNEDYVPYWSYSTQAVNENYFYQSLRFPSIEEIQIDVEKYVEDNLLTCLNNLSSLNYAGNLEIKSEPEIKVIIADSDVKIRGDLDIFVEKENKYVEEYYTELDFPFKQIMEMGMNIVIEHQQSQFIERMLLRLIGFYGDVDSKKMPPFYMTTSGFDYVMWSQQDVNYKIKRMMQSYTQMLKIRGSLNSEFNTPQMNLEGLSEMEKNFFLSGQIDLPYYQDIILDSKVNFIYNDFQTHSRVFCRRCNENMIQPLEFSRGGVVSAPEMEYEYEFFYDITAPVVVEMKFDTKLKGQPEYTFLLGLETNIRKNLISNELIEKGSIPWSDDFVTITLNKPSVELNEETGEYENVVNTFSSSELKEKLFANEEQRISKDVIVKVYDEGTLEEIEGAVISLVVGDYASLLLGITKEQENKEIFFKEKAPIVSQGHLLIQKEGYADEYKEISTSISEEREVIIKLSKVQDKNFTIRVFDMNDFTFRKLNENERVTIFLTKQMEEDRLNKFQTVLYFNSPNGIEENKLVPGKYVVNALFVDNDGVIIPKQCERICEKRNLLNQCSKYVRIPENDIEFKPALWGGLSFTSENPLNFPENKVYEENTIELTVIKYPTSEETLKIVCLDSINLMNNIENITLAYEPNVKPRYIVS